MQEGSRFGPYELIKRIAFGGMAEIHLAKTSGIGGFEKLLALKVIHPKYSEDQEFIDMLIDEAKIAVQLSHVNIAQVFDLGKVDGTYYIAMEFIDGKDLYQLLVRCSELEIDIPFDIIVFIAMETCAGLQYAHTKSDNYGRPLNLIHRDISPQNVLVSYDGEVKVVDFGIAKASQRSKETESGVIKGKFFYMSPEQAWGDDIDARTDIFSTAICLYEMITGEMLYNEEKALVLLDKVRKAQIPPMRQRRPDLPPALEQIVLKGLAREREHRFQTSGALQGALSAFLYSNWPQFSRRRVSDFMLQVFGDNRFVLPMPAPGSEADKRTVEMQSAGGFMGMDDFDVSDGHSVIFDMRKAAPLQQPVARVQPAAASFDEDERTQAAKIAQQQQDDDDDEEERTITEAVWAADSGMAGLVGLADNREDEDDRTAVIDSVAVEAALAPPAPRGDDPEDLPTSLFDARSGAAMPQQLKRPVTPTAGPNAPANAPAPAANPIPQAPMNPTPVARPSAQPRPAPAPTPAPAPVPSPGPAAPAPRPSTPNRSGEGSRPTLSGSARRQPAKKSFGKKLLSPTGITVIVLIGLLVYGAIVLLPTLTKEDKPKTGALVVTTVPSGATVWLDGQDTGKVTPARIDNMQVGANHELKLTLKGYDDHRQPVNVSKEELDSAGGEIRRRVVLEKGKGKLVVSSEPPGADVILNGVFVGKTPLTKKDLSREKNEVVLLLRLDGYRQKKATLTWEDEVELKYAADLQKRGQ